MCTAVWLAVVLSVVQTLGAQGIEPIKAVLVAELPCNKPPIVPETWCVDLSNGKAESSPNWAQWVSYVNKPGCCNDQGVLRLTPPSWAKSLRIEESASGSSGWTLNLGDSPTNNGWGGDGGSTAYDAELQILNGQFNVYRNDVCGSGWQSGSSGSVGSTRTSSITVEKWGVKVDSTPSGFSYSSTCNRCLYNWSPMYLGLNRVVSTSSRSGRGLCKVCIRLSPYATFKPCLTFPNILTSRAAADPAA